MKMGEIPRTPPPQSAPVISVIIPTFNSADYIPQALDSVLNQTYRDFEIIVVDDGSTDHTQTVLAPYMPQIRYIWRENGGPSRARNAGIQAARGRYIAFLDADDLWVPTKLEVQAQVLDTRPEVGLVFGDTQVFDRERILVDSFLRQKRQYSALAASPTVEQAFLTLIRDNFIPTSTVMVRRQCIATVGMFDESLLSAEDKDLWLRIAMRFGIACIPSVLERKRSHGSNVSGNGDLAVGCEITVMQKIMSMCAPDSWECKAAIRRRLSILYFWRGYSCFDRGEMKDARKALAESLQRHFRREALLYYLASFLGGSLIALVRSTKRKYVALKAGSALC